jgi:hypothetical protein
MQALTSLPGQTYNQTTTRQAPTKPWLQDFWLWILLIGPLTAPLFTWTNWPILKPFADAIYLLGAVVCPKLPEHLLLLDYPMSVCVSCWSAVFGLWTIRLLYGRAGEGMGGFSALNLAPTWQRWSNAPTGLKLAVLALGFFPWALDVLTWDLGLWTSPRFFMSFAGYMGGLAAGALLLPAASAMRAALASRRTVRYSI